MPEFTNSENETVKLPDTIEGADGTIEDIHGATWRCVVAEGQTRYEWRETNNNAAQWKRHPADKVPGSIIDELGGAAVGRTWESAKGQRKVMSIKTVGDKKVAMVSRPGLTGLEIIDLKDLDKEIAFEQKQAASSKKMGEAVAAKKKKEQEAKAAREDFQGYEGTLNPKMRARMITALNRTALYDGKLKTQKQAIQDMVAQGRRVKDSKYFGRILEDPKTGGFLAEKDLSKFGLDYAKHLTKEAKKEAPRP